MKQVRYSSLTGELKIAQSKIAAPKKLEIKKKHAKMENKIEKVTEFKDYSIFSDNPSLVEN